MLSLISSGRFPWLEERWKFYRTLQGLGASQFELSKFRNTIRFRLDILKEELR